jgi:hypothetical protein
LEYLGPNSFKVLADAEIVRKPGSRKSKPVATEAVAATPVETKTEAEPVAKKKAKKKAATKAATKAAKKAAKKASA